MTQITESNSVQQQPHTFDLRSEAAGLYAMGSAEAAIAIASASIEEQQDRTRQARVSQRQVRREAQEEQLSKMDEAATWRCAAGVVDGASQVGSGLCTAAGAGGDNSIAGQATAIGGAGSVDSAVLNFIGSKADVAAKAAEMRSDELGENVQSLGADLDRSGRMLDKALAHNEQISEARHQSRMAAIRG